MTIKIIFILIGIGLSLITVFGDMLVKHASLKPKWTGWLILLAGALIYGLTALGWFFVMRKIKLSTLAITYSVSGVIFLTLVSVFYFREKIHPIEIFAIIMAIISLIIIGRFA